MPAARQQQEASRPISLLLLLFVLRTTTTTKTTGCTANREITPMGSPIIQLSEAGRLFVNAHSALSERTEGVEIDPAADVDKRAAALVICRVCWPTDRLAAWTARCEWPTDRPTDQVVVLPAVAPIGGGQRGDFFSQAQICEQNSLIVQLVDYVAGSQPASETAFVASH